MSDCIQKINVSGQAFCSWCHEKIRYRLINQYFAPFFSNLLNIILIFATFGALNNSEPGIRRGNEDSRENEN